MTTIKLSKPESKYRSKLVAEWNLKKSEQKLLDDFISKNSMYTYKKLYFEFRTEPPIIPNALFSSISLCKAMRAFASIKINVRNADKSFKRLHDVLREASDKWEDGIIQDEKDRVVEAFNNCL